MPDIRPEEATDSVAIREINEAAFERHNEADLIEVLRQNGGVLVSLVASVDDKIVGHVLFSPVSVEGYDEIYECAALGPVAVLPDYQNQGIGSALIRAGLDACKAQGYNVVFVLGDPAYYSRFGFTETETLQLKIEFEGVSPEHFMVAQLKEDAVVGIFGTVYYMPAFKNV